MRMKNALRLKFRKKAVHHLKLMMMMVMMMMMKEEDASQHDLPQLHFLDEEKIATIVRRVVKDEVRKVVKEEMNNLFERMKNEFFEAKDKPSSRGTHDDPDVEVEKNVRDKETVECDTMKSPSPMPEHEMAGLHDDAGFASSAIVVYQDRPLPTPVEIEPTPVEIEKIDVDDPLESPKGRGHRKKRKAAVLCTPWRNIEKRKKFATVTEYDPFRPVDPAKLVNDGWLSTEHVDEALFHIRERGKQFPHLFRQDCLVLDTFFVPYVRNFFKDMSKTKQLPRALSRYGRGEIPNNGKPWTACTKLYVPFCKEGNGHWLALEIDLSLRCINIYDNETSVMRRAELEKQLEPIRVVVPMLLMQLNANYSAEKFEYKRLTSPSQSNGFDCGMFTIKFIEFLHAGKNVEGVEQSQISIWREKLAAEIYGAHFDP